MAALNPVPTDRPLISVIMPCYNCAPYLAEAAGSALRQGYGNVELILIDDGSADESSNIEADLARQYGNRLSLLQARRVGPYPARNLGLKSARGELIAFLDADDWWEPTALEKMHAAMVHANADLAYCGWQNVGAGMAMEPYVPPEYESGDPVEGFMRGSG